MIAIGSLKKGESADSKGIKAEDIEGADEETITMIHEIFNLIIKQNTMAPSSWRKVMITVIYKNGDATNTENYRPICGVSRLCAELDRYQCPDMAGFRKSSDDGSSCAVQTHLPEKQRVENRHVGGGDRLLEGIRFITTGSSLEISQKPLDNNTFSS